MHYILRTNSNSQNHQFSKSPKSGNSYQFDHFYRLNLKSLFFMHFEVDFRHIFENYRKVFEKFTFKILIILSFIS